jgi:hypothetical protein
MTNSIDKSAPKQITFNTNPFSVAFGAMSRMFKINQNPAIAIIVGGIIVGVINQITSSASNVGNTFFDESASDTAKAGLVIFSVLFWLAFIFISTLVANVWSGFVTYAGLMNARYESVQVKPSLRFALGKFWRILGLSIIMSLVWAVFLFPAIVVLITAVVIHTQDNINSAIGVYIAAGLVAIVGIVFAARYALSKSLSLYAMFDESLSISASLKRSSELTKSRLIEVWGMSFPGAIIPIIGTVLTTAGMGDYYLQLKTYRDHKAELPKTHILSWLPVMLLAFIALLALLIGGIALAIYASR